MRFSLSNNHKSLFFTSLAIIGFLVSSCGVSKKLPTGPSPLETIQTHYQDKNWRALLNDINEFPEYRDDIRAKLIKGLDYSNFSYSTLKLITELSSSDFEASAYFDSLLFARETVVLENLSKMDIADAAAYYRNDSRDHEFLHQAILETYLAGIDSLDYTTVKNIYTAFLDSDLAPAITPAYNSIRNSILAEVNAGLDAYFSQEEDILSDVEYGIRAKLDPYVEKGVQNVVIGMSEKLDRGLFKKVFHREEQDRYSAYGYYSKLVSENFDSDYISKTVLSKVSDYIVSSTSLRKEYIQDYMPDYESCDFYYIPSSTVDSLSFYLQISSSDASDIQTVKTTGAIISIASVALMFTPAGWIGAAVDAADLVNGVTEDSRISRMIDSMASNIYSDTASCINQYLSNVFGIIRQRRESSQNYLRNRINNEI